MKKQVDIDVLKEHYPDEFDREYDIWQDTYCEFIDEAWDSDMSDLATEWLKGTGWDVGNVIYQLSHGQGDGVALDATFEYSLISEEKLNELRERFPMCAEMLRREMLWVGSRLSHRGPLSNADWTSDYPHSDYLDISDETLEGGVYHGMPLFTAVQLCEEEDEERVANFLHEDIRDVEDKLYQWMLDEHDYQTSEDMFIEWAREFEETFEVEEDEEVEA